MFPRGGGNELGAMVVEVVRLCDLGFELGEEGCRVGCLAGEFAEEGHEEGEGFGVGVLGFPVVDGVREADEDSGREVEGEREPDAHLCSGGILSVERQNMHDEAVGTEIIAV